MLRFHGRDLLHERKAKECHFDSCSILLVAHDLPIYLPCCALVAAKGLISGMMSVSLADSGDSGSSFGIIFNHSRRLAEVRPELRLWTALRMDSFPLIFVLDSLHVREF